MISFRDFIIESQAEDIFASNRAAIEMVDSLKNAFTTLATNKAKYSLTNQTEAKKVFDKVVKSLKFGDSNRNMQFMKKFGLYTPEKLAIFILSNPETLKSKRFNLDWVKNFDLSAAEQEYKKWKDSKDYVEGKLFDKREDDEEPEKRMLIVYDRHNPEVHMQFDFIGKRGKQTDHQVNMMRVQFHYATDVKYYDCYPCLGSYYYSKSVEELKKDDQQMIDPKEFDMHESLLEHVIYEGEMVGYAKIIDKISKKQWDEIRKITRDEKSILDVTEVEERMKKGEVNVKDAAALADAVLKAANMDLAEYAEIFNLDINKEDDKIVAIADLLINLEMHAED